MKKSSIARIMILVLSLALLIGSTMAITAMANEETADGTFGAISTGYGDKVYIRVEVKATQEQIEKDDVVVSYVFGGETKTATFFEESKTADYVWVITEGIAAYDLTKEVVFSSAANGEQVETNRTYSVAQFLYKKLYTDAEVTAEYKAMYEALIQYGKTAQIALQQNTDKMINNSTLVYTNNANITFGGKDFAFVPGAGATVTPTYNGTLADNEEVVGWKILVNNEEQTVEATFTCSGVVEIIAPVTDEHDHGISYDWADDYSSCTATAGCTEHAATETVKINKVTLDVTATDATYVYAAEFENTLFGVHTMTLTAERVVADGVVTINAPAMAGLVPSHDYVKLGENEEATFTFYYSELSAAWDGTASESLIGSGTAEDPYLIQSAEDLAYIDVNMTATENFKGVYFKLTKSIDLGGKSMKIGEYPGWNGRITFCGIFDGNNCSIRNLNMTESGKGAGLFSVVKGTVKNLTVYGSVKGDDAMTGGIVGWLYKQYDEDTATLENCASYVKVISTGATETGGMVGTCQKGTITNCQNYGDVIGVKGVGGVAGYASNTITNSHNFGLIAGSESFNGIYGAAHSSGTPTVTDCNNYGTILEAWDGETATQPEGDGSEANPYLIASGANLLWIEQEMMTATNADNLSGVYFKMTGHINLGGHSVMIGDCPTWGTRRAFAGIFDGNGYYIVNLNINDTTGKATGLFGMVTGTVQNLTVHGTVKGTGQPIGGIIGYLRLGTLSNCVSYVNVTSTGGAAEVGGLVGTSQNANIVNCVNYGSVSGITSVGGVVGTASGTIDGCAFYGSFTGTATTTGEIYGAQRNNETLTAE